MSVTFKCLLFALSNYRYNYGTQTSACTLISCYDENVESYFIKNTFFKNSYISACLFIDITSAVVEPAHIYCEVQSF